MVFRFREVSLLCIPSFAFWPFFSALYFSKVMRQLLKHCRSKGYIVLFYLDDGIEEPIPLGSSSGGQFSWLHLELRVE